VRGFRGRHKEQRTQTHDVTQPPALGLRFARRENLKQMLSCSRPSVALDISRNSPSGPLQALAKVSGSAGEGFQANLIADLEANPCQRHGGPTELLGTRNQGGNSQFFRRVKSQEFRRTKCWIWNWLAAQECRQEGLFHECYCRELTTTPFPRLQVDGLTLVYCGSLEGLTVIISSLTRLSAMARATMPHGCSSAGLNTERLRNTERRRLPNYCDLRETPHDWIRE
jgi:hypothetical protein